MLSIGRCWAAALWVIVVKSAVMAEWTPQDAGTRVRLEAVAFFSPDTGHICGGSGVLLRTVDGGRTWLPLLSPLGDVGLRKVHFLNGRIGLVLTSSGEVARTADGGQTWMPIPGLAAPVTALHMDERKRLFLGGRRSQILYSEDSGTTWAASGIPETDTNSGIYGLHFPGPDTGFALSNRGVFRTTDGGKAWTLKVDLASSPVFSGSIFQSLFFLNADEGLLGSIYYSRIVRTEDGAGSFVRVSLFPVRALCFPTQDTGYAAGNDGRIYRSGDRGRTWSVDTDIGRSAIKLYDLTFPGPGSGIAVGDSGVILRYQGGPVSLAPGSRKTGGKGALRGTRPFRPGRFDSLGKTVRDSVASPRLRYRFE